jgi:hypothetical protein
MDRLFCETGWGWSEDHLRLFPGQFSTAPVDGARGFPGGYPIVKPHFMAIFLGKMMITTDLGVSNFETTPRITHPDAGHRESEEGAGCGTTSE